MKMPLVFDENGDVSLYWSLGDAQKNIEAIDVKNNEYAAYDAAGRMLLLKAVDDLPIDITLAEDEPRHRQELVGALRRYVGARQRRGTLDTLSLEELLHVVQTDQMKN